MNNFNNCNGDPRDTLIFSTEPPPTWMDGENNIDWRKMYENKCNHKRNVDKNVSCPFNFSICPLKICLITLIFSNCSSYR